MQVHARAGRHFEKKEFSGAPSRGLKWDNKTYMLKRSILMIVRKKIVPYRCLLPRLQQWMGSQLLWLANNRRRSLL